MPSEYQSKVERERAWYTEHRFQPHHWLNSRLFFSTQRNNFNYSFPRSQFASFARGILAADQLAPRDLLIAPYGTGVDVPYFGDLNCRITGIDISAAAMANDTHSDVRKVVGDMASMDMLSDSSFDVVVISLFFHHFVSFGFAPFLEEAHRVLRPGGWLFSLEPSSLYPVSWITAAGRHIFGNISGKVEDEAPFRPQLLITAMKHAGFTRVSCQAASFSHNRFPVRLANLVNSVTRPLLTTPGIRQCAWMCAFAAQKETGASARTD
jgi:SAM-dependent methyltransferase